MTTRSLECVGLDNSLVQFACLTLDNHHKDAYCFGIRCKGANLQFFESRIIPTSIIFRNSVFAVAKRSGASLLGLHDTSGPSVVSI